MDRERAKWGRPMITRRRHSRVGIRFGTSKLGLLAAQVAAGLAYSGRADPRCREPNHLHVVRRLGDFFPRHRHAHRHAHRHIHLRSRHTCRNRRRYHRHRPSATRYIRSYRPVRIQLYNYGYCHIKHGRPPILHQRLIYHPRSSLSSEPWFKHNPRRDRQCSPGPEPRPRPDRNARPAGCRSLPYQTTGEPG